MAIWLEYTVGGAIAATAIAAGILLNRVLNSTTAVEVDTVTSTYQPSWAVVASVVTDVPVKRAAAAESLAS